MLTGWLRYPDRILTFINPFIHEDKVIFSFYFYLFKAIRKCKIMQVAHILFLMDNAVLEQRAWEQRGEKNYGIYQRSAWHDASGATFMKPSVEFSPTVEITSLEELLIELRDNWCTCPYSAQRGFNQIESAEFSVASRPLSLYGQYSDITWTEAWNPEKG